MILENPRFQLIPAAPELAEEIRSMTSFYGRCPWIPEPGETAAGGTDKDEE